MMFLNRYAALSHSLLRIVAAFIWMCHGGQKLLGWFGGMGEGSLPPLMMAAGGIELVGGALLMLGLFTRPVAFIASGEMAFAYFMMHAPNGPLPIVNHGETPALLSFIFLYLAANGPGGLSVDSMKKK